MIGRVGTTLCAMLLASAAAWKQTPRWIAEPVVRAGTLDGPGALGEVFDVEIMADGSMLVAQPDAATISVFGSDGEFRRTVGRRGQGPGEFQVPGRMGWNADTLWVIDFGRLHLFTGDLEFIRTIVHPSLAPPPRVQRLIPGPVLADGSVLGVPVFPDSGRIAPFVRISPTGAIVDTVFHLEERNSYVRVEMGGTRPANVMDPWMTNPLWLLAEDGASVAVVTRDIAGDESTASFEVMRLGLRGDTILRRRLVYVPVTPGKELVDRTFRAMAARVAPLIGVLEARAEREIRQAIRVPRYLPPVSALVLGGDSTIWLRRESAGGPDVQWDVYDHAVRPLGRLSLPEGFRMHRAHRTRVWGTEKDSLDVSYVRVYDVAPASR